MFEEIQKVFRKSLEAFRSEVSKREPEDQVAELLTAMRRELVSARASLPLLEAEVAAARREVERERGLLEQCERRRALAERIGDEETVRIAGEFAERHRSRVALLEQKLKVAEAERALRAGEVEVMERQYKESEANRFVLVAQLRQQRTRERMNERLGEEGGAFADFARMEDAVADRTAYAEAAGEMRETPPPPRRAPADSAAEVEARLAELKRRMGRE